MNRTEYMSFIRGKKVSVIGVGVSNVPLIEFLLSGGAVVTAHDKKTAEELGEVYKKLSDMGISFVLGEKYLEKIPWDCEIIFKTPGLRCDIPELNEARNRGVKITSEMELFFELCPCKIIAVTGSDGKTTTTTLIGEMLKHEGYRCFVGGNIGRPLLADTAEMKSDDMAVLELSSFQLHSMKCSPNVAVITNITPNHLDWHTDYDEYIMAKKNIFKGLAPNGKVVLNNDNAITRSFANETENSLLFSRTEMLENGVCLEDGHIVLKNGGESKRILAVGDIKIPGMHNVENYMAAIAALNEYVSVDTINYVAKNFGGVPHRIELVREIDDVKYYNDSIASSPARTTAGLKAFDEKVILIAGGYDKKIPFDDFGAVINEHVKELVLVGVTSEKIENAVKNAPNYDGLKIHRETDFEEAVITARNLAEKGDTVILSPACASFDLFKNFEQRGNRFKEIVMSF